MKIETKFNIGDVVWFRDKHPRYGTGLVIECHIDEIDIYKDVIDGHRTVYNTNYMSGQRLGFIAEKLLFKTELEAQK